MRRGERERQETHETREQEAESQSVDGIRESLGNVSPSNAGDSEGQDHRLKDLLCLPLAIVVLEGVVSARRRQGTDHVRREALEPLHQGPVTGRTDVLVGE